MTHPPKERPLRVGPLGTNLKFARNFRGWTLRDLGARAGISNATLCQVETGQHDLTAMKLARLAVALDVSTDWLLGLSDDPGSRRGKVRR